MCERGLKGRRLIMMDGPQLMPSTPADIQAHLHGCQFQKAFASLLHAMRLKTQTHAPGRFVRGVPCGPAAPLPSCPVRQAHSASCITYSVCTLRGTGHGRDRTVSRQRDGETLMGGIGHARRRPPPTLYTATGLDSDNRRLQQAFPVAGVHFGMCRCDLPPA